MEIEKMLEIILVALACPICIPLVLEDNHLKEGVESDEKG